MFGNYVLLLLDKKWGPRVSKRERARGVKGNAKESQYQGVRNRDGTYRSSWGVSGRQDKFEPGLIYLIESSGLDAFKIGISSSIARTNRVEQHTKSGWTVIRTWSTENLVVAREVEKAVLRWWRNELGLGSATSHLMQGGASETVSRSSISASDCIARIEILLDDAGQLATHVTALPNLQSGVFAITTGRLVRVESERLGKRRTRYGKISSETWWKVTLRDDGSFLTLEFAPRKSVSLRHIPLGSILEVKGRVEVVHGHKRMTNPEWRIVNVGRGWDRWRVDKHSKAKLVRR